MYMGFSPPTIIFFFSILLGALVGLIWDINRILKNNVKSNRKKFMFFLDILFCVVTSILTISFFFIYTYSGFRLFVLIGMLIGFILFYCTIEQPIYFVLNIVFKFIFKILRFFKKSLEFLADILQKILVKLKNLIYNQIYLKIRKKLKNIKNKRINYKNAEDEYILKNIFKKLNKYIKKNNL